MGLICKHCNSKEVRNLSIINNHQVYQCKICLLIQTDVKISESKKINVDTYDCTYLNGYLNIRRTQLTELYKKRIKDIELYVQGGSLLDVGCGPGLFLETVLETSKYKWSVKGIDINPKSLKKVNKELQKHVLLSSIDSNIYANDTFDVVSCFDSIEHFSYLDKSLSEINRILKNDGLLVVQVPNYDSTMRKICNEDWDWWCIPDHLFHFQIFTLKTILRKHGFQIIKIQTWEPFDTFVKNTYAHIKKQFPGFLRLDKIIAKPILIPLCIIWLLHKIIDTKKGGLIYLLAKKNETFSNYYY